MIRVLGPIQVIAEDGHAIDLPSVTQRRLLAVLAVHAPNRVRAERLAEVLGVSAGGLRTSVSRLRKALGGRALASVSGGYQLTAAVDAQLFCRAVAAVPAGTGRASAAASLATLEEALGLWAGPALEEFAEEEWARVKRPGFLSFMPGPPRTMPRRSWRLAGALTRSRCCPGTSRAIPFGTGRED